MVQETRLYDPARDETRSMRSKEDAHDYRYFPDPDLLPLAIGDAEIERLRAQLPELPQAKRAHYVASLGLSSYDAGVLTQSRAMSEYFERVIAAFENGHRLAATWLTGEFSAALNRTGTEIGQAPVSGDQLAGLLRRIADRTLSGRMAKEVFEAMWDGEGSADDVIAKRGLRQISDAGAIGTLVDEVIAANPKQVADFRAGRDKAFNSLVGQVMKASRGKADPAQVAALLRERLAG